ncbi:MAG: hypothetical protein JNJ54_31655 [Myxococcaceae bacterium]|nr:hypothetical protein [Myxococcaceae bacterium]
MRSFVVFGQGLTDEPGYGRALEQVSAAADLFDDSSKKPAVVPMGEELRFARLRAYKEVGALLEATKEVWSPQLAKHKAATFTEAELANALVRLENVLYRYRQGSGWQLEHPSEVFSSAIKGVDEKINAKKPFLEDIERKVDDVRFGLALLEYSGVTGERLEAARKLFEATKSKAEKAMAELAEKASAPKNTYGGADRQKLFEFIRSEWRRRYPDEQLLQVWLAGSWERATGARRVSDEQVVKFDASVLRVSVATARDGKIADVWRAFLEKDHLQRDQIKFLRDPFGKTFVAVKNLKK